VSQLALGSRFASNAAFWFCFQKRLLQTLKASQHSCLPTSNSKSLLHETAKNSWRMSWWELYWSLAKWPNSLSPHEFSMLPPSSISFSPEIFYFSRSRDPNLLCFCAHDYLLNSCLLIIRHHSLMDQLEFCGIDSIADRNCNARMFALHFPRPVPNRILQMWPTYIAAFDFVYCERALVRHFSNDGLNQGRDYEAFLANQRVLG